MSIITHNIVMLIISTALLKSTYIDLIAILFHAVENIITISIAFHCRSRHFIMWIYLLDRALME